MNGEVVERNLLTGELFVDVSEFCNEYDNFFITQIGDVKERLRVEWPENPELIVIKIRKIGLLPEIGYKLFFNINMGTDIADVLN